MFPMYMGWIHIHKKIRFYMWNFEKITKNSFLSSMTWLWDIINSKPSNFKACYFGSPLTTTLLLISWPWSQPPTRKGGQLGGRPTGRKCGDVDESMSDHGSLWIISIISLLNCFKFLGLWEKRELGSKWKTPTNIWLLIWAIWILALFIRRIHLYTWSYPHSSSFTHRLASPCVIPRKGSKYCAYVLSFLLLL